MGRPAPKSGHRLAASPYRITSSGLASVTFHAKKPSFNRPLVAHSIRMKDFYYIDTDEIPGFFLLLKNHIFIARSQDTIFIFSV